MTGLLGCDLSICWIVNDYVVSFPFFIVWGLLGGYLSWEGLKWYSATYSYEGMLIDGSLNGIPLPIKVEPGGRVLSFRHVMGATDRLSGAVEKATVKSEKADVVGRPIIYRKGLKTAKLYLISLKKKITIDISGAVEAEGSGESAVRANEEPARDSVIELVRNAKQNLKDRLIDGIMWAFGGGGVVAVVMLVTGFHK